MMTKSKFAAAVLCLALCIGSWSCTGKVKQYTVKVVAEYNHDVSSYTQGLFFHDGELFESTGQYGSSTFRKVDLATGKALKRLDFGKKYFIEGSVMLDGNLYILTWTNKMVFVYDAATLGYKQSWSYPREGWGLTTDGRSLIASDGTARIYFLDRNLKQERFINVKLNGKYIKYINELEWIDGKIWANVYTTDTILIINPEDGNVEGVVDCEGLLPDKLRTYDTDVLNGIAFNPADGKIYLTGKNWPKMYEIRLVEQK